MLSNNKICQECKEPLTQNDDVVVCPYCGAPYHRECYEKAGKCVYEELHGSGFEYKPDETEQKEESPDKKTLNCANCGHTFSEDENFCPNCRTPKGVTFNIPFGFNQEAEVIEEKVDEDGISSSMVKAFSLVNGYRYVQKYFSLNKQSKKSWNWAAFLVPEGWFFYRKMYKAGFVAVLLMIISTVCLIPFVTFIAPYFPEGQRVMGMEETVKLYSKIAAEMDLYTSLMAWLGVTLNFFVRLISGLFGDYIYKCFTKEKLLNYKPKAEEEELPLFIRLGRLGGVKPFMFLIGFMAVQYLPMFIQALII